jgi:hypothetical protein
MMNQTASRTATRSYSPSYVEIRRHSKVPLGNNDRWRTSGRSGERDSFPHYRPLRELTPSIQVRLPPRSNIADSDLAYEWFIEATAEPGVYSIAWVPSLRLSGCDYLAD